MQQQRDRQSVKNQPSHCETTSPHHVFAGGHTGRAQAGEARDRNVPEGADGFMQPRQQLTLKEVQVAILVWEGLTNRDIASRLQTTEQVVKNYLRNTFDKLGVWSRLELALYVARHGGQKWHDDAALDRPAET